MEGVTCFEGKDMIGTISIEKLEEIAKIKLADLNCEDNCRWWH